MSRNRKQCVGFPPWQLVWLVLATGCSSMPDTPTEPPGRRSCLDFYRALEREVAADRVADAGAHPVDGYPYLRLDRFLASFRDQLTNEAGYRTWLAALADTDLRARRLELANLTLSARQRLAREFGPRPSVQLTRCSLLLRRQPGYQSAAGRQLLEAAEVPDSYVTWQRALGLYPLARLPALGAIERLHQRLQQPFLEPPEAHGRQLVYRPVPVATAPDTRQRPPVRPVMRDPLGVPVLPVARLHHLYRRHAPVLVVDTINGNDKIGRVYWSEPALPAVDTAQPLVYRYLSHSRFQGQVLVQLNYLFWFPARDTGDIYAGRLDALLWRVTLDRQLSPVAYDSIHGCGCYYQIFPASGYRVRDLQDSGEPVFSPLPAPPLASGQRLRLRLAAGTHYLQGVTVTAGEQKTGIGYSAEHYDRLRSLPLPDGGRRSLFTDQGLVPGSERPERFLLWPFGIRSAGAMRQPGTHAIAFVGRRHFDDPFLLDRLLENDPEEL